MMRRTTLTFLTLLLSLASFAITGPSTICTGSSATFTDSVAGVVSATWSSSNPAICSVTFSSTYYANVQGVAAGTATLTYTPSPGTPSYMVVTVAAGPAAISGPSSVCVGSTANYTDATPGGTWSSASPGLSINATTGVATGVYATVATIYYNTSTCSASKIVTVSSATSDSIMGASTVCVGSTISLMTSGSSSGTWSSSNLTVATVTGGVVSGIAGGTATISYTYTGACGVAVATHVVTVTTTSSAGTIGGPSSIAVSATGSLYATVSGGAWSSSNPSVATISSTGVVTGVAAGTTTISYAVSGCGPTVYATYVVTVTTPSGISGYVHYSGTANVKVWLIKYNPSTSMLTAVDSTYAYGTDSAYYQFLGLATDSFRVKAALDSAILLGFVPTYHTSSFYWNTATVIPHTSGTWDAHKDINMIAGTPTTGPGFIGGSVLTGANKGTTDGAPVVGLGIYLVNSATSAVVGYTTTDAAGNYSFSSLPLATYYVFPEELNYTTIPYTGITLTSSSPSMATAKFRERTISKIIQPVTAAVNNLNGANTSIVAFPNPTSGKLNITWETAASEAASIIITDVTGREVIAKGFSMTKGNGAEVVDLTQLTNGMYFVSVKSANTMYVTKVEVRH
jgi:hypothetical protein